MLLQNLRCKVSNSCNIIPNVLKFYFVRHVLNCFFKNYPWLYTLFLEYFQLFGKAPC